MLFQMTGSPRLTRHRRPIAFRNAIGDEGLLLFILEQFVETVAVRHLHRAQHLISVLKNRACSFSLDDFGQGLNSLTQLKHLDVDYLKIDGSFVNDLATDYVDFAIVEAVLRMAQAMGLKTIAEYAESDAIIAKLQQIGVDYAQGIRLRHLRCSLPHKISRIRPCASN